MVCPPFSLETNMNEPKQQTNMSTNQQQQSSEKIVNAVIRCLCLMFVCSEHNIPKLEEYVLTSWHSDEFSFGSYSFMGVGSNSDSVSALRQRQGVCVCVCVCEVRDRENFGFDYFSFFSKIKIDIRSDFICW